ncbi:MAG TPA: PEGA domain-containing protein [Rhabdochlamydiaceae bacterium]|nr:PEGA domain-containing protein [Rhabdochlamydiaceae bacterium]
MKTPKQSIFFASIPLLFLTSCATIMHGTKESVGISSNPSNADVWVDNTFVGTSPTIVQMTRKDNHFIRIELKGYEPYEIALTRKLSGWVFGNIVFGGVIGLAVDAISGGLYQLTPAQIQAEMQKGNIAYSKKSGDSYIAVVMTPDVSWKKVGHLVASN